MKTEFSKLPNEIENYRNRMRAGHWSIKTPEIVRRYWRDEIEPSNLCSLGEEGVKIFLKKHSNLSEKNLICFARQAETSGYIEMENGFWKYAYLKSTKDLLAPKNKKRENKISKLTESEAKNLTVSFQELWFTLLREQEKYSCYSIFFALPSDKEAMRYLEEYNNDLQLISSNTLVMKMGRDKLLHAEMAEKSLSAEVDYGRLARLFEINFTMFPCIVIFEDVNPLKGIPVFLSEMNAEEIFQKTKIIFSIIQNSIMDKKSSLKALQQHKNDERLKHAGKVIIGTIQEYANLAIKTFIDTWIKTALNSK